VLAVAGFLALALLVALVNAASSGPDGPPSTDHGIYEDYLDQRGRELTDQQRRQQCEESREDIPELTC
jgi:hypothetical protein